MLKKVVLFLTLLVSLSLAPSALAVVVGPDPGDLAEVTLPEYRGVQVFAENNQSLLEQGNAITAKEKESRLSWAKTLYQNASEIREESYSLQLRKAQKLHKRKASLAIRKAESKIRFGKIKIKQWYKKNSDHPKAKQKAERMLNDLEKKWDGWLEEKLLKTENEHQIRVAAIETGNERITSWLQYYHQLSLGAIERIPSIN